VLAAVSIVAAAPRAQQATDLPGSSLYHVPIVLETANGLRTRLDAFRGSPLLITMFYTRCTSVCPLLTLELKRLDGRIGANERTRLRVLMVSLDAERDTPAVLAAFASEHHVDDPRWVLARASASDVRLLAATLGIRYRRLSDGEFDHSSTIVLLDRDGVPRDRTSELLGSDDEFANATELLLKAAPR
jgi:protein SCO1/2